MIYTLFVDESGHFGYDDRKEAWVVGGVLCPMDRNSAEKVIGNRLNPIPSRYGLTGRGEMHRTDLIQSALSGGSEWTISKVDSLTETVFETVHEVTPGARLLAVRNPSQRGLSHPEETYRLMLLDLIGLADATLPADQPLDRLELCIASRTRRGEGRMSTRDDLSSLLKRIEDAIEVDLASRGLLGVLADDISLQQQKTSWMLTVADFWCNTVYNQRHEGPQRIVNSIVQSGRGRVFTTGGDDARIRRAQVAERDGMFGLALYRWASLPLEGDEAHRQHEALKRLCQQVTGLSTRSPRPTFEVVIEMLWRDFGETERYDTFLAGLSRVIDALESIAGDESASTLQPILFRMRNMLQLAANRDGQTERAKAVGARQKAVERQLVQDPANFSLVLDSQLNRIHTLQHTLRFDQALEVATKHRDRVTMYGDLWDLYEDDTYEEDADAFEASRMNVKATMTWILTRIQAATVDEPLDDVLVAIKQLRKVDMAPYDRGRLLNYSILARLKRGWFEGALSESKTALREAAEQGSSNPYAIAHAMRAAATTALADKATHHSAIMTVYETARDFTKDEARGVFWGLIGRDRALLEMLLNSDTKASRKALRQGKAALTWNTGTAKTAIRQWVEWTFDVTGQFISKENAFRMHVPERFQEVVGQATLEGHSGLLRVRRVSPY
jgi:hypothetical protein